MTVVDVYPEVVVRASRLEVPLPSVIALNDYVKKPNGVSSSGQDNCHVLKPLMFCTLGVSLRIFILTDTGLYQKKCVLAGRISLSILRT